MKELKLSTLIQAVEKDNNLIAKIKIAERLYNNNYEEADINLWLKINIDCTIERRQKLAEELYYMMVEINEYKNYKE